MVIMTPDILNDAINKAKLYANNAGHEVLSDYALSVEGMTSPKIKAFLNILNKKLHICKYLEIGLYKGATFISAIEGNSGTFAVGCDNWSQFKGPKSTFFENLENCPGGAYTTIYDIDCFSQKFKDKIAHLKFDVVFYDGDHSFESQTMAVELFKEVMNDSAILIVDDWHKWGDKPTRQAIKDNKLKIEAEWILPKSKGYWEGVGVFVLTK